MRQWPLPDTAHAPDWRMREAKPHASQKISNLLFREVCERLNQIIKLL